MSPASANHGIIKRRGATCFELVGPLRPHGQGDQLTVRDALHWDAGGLAAPWCFSPQANAIPRALGRTFRRGRERLAAA